MKKQQKGSITLEASVSAFLILTLLVCTLTVSSLYVEYTKFQNALNNTAQIVASFCSVKGDDASIIKFLKTADVCEGECEGDIKPDEFAVVIEQSKNLSEEYIVVDKLLADSDLLVYTAIKLAAGEVGSTDVENITQIVCHAFFLKNIGVSSLDQTETNYLINFYNLNFSESSIAGGDTVDIGLSYTYRFITPIKIINDKLIEQRSSAKKW